ncbi:MAG: hypothetical protein IKG87_02390 [Clostridia bacterium]|nr:hypothetical protein [Clostridia bacterium]
MNYELSRALSVYADGKALVGFRRAYLSGRDALGLYPMPFILRLWNLADSDYHLLRAAKHLSVRHEDSVLASGRVSDVYLRIVPEGKITEVVFAAGLGLWETPVSLSVEAGVSVSDTVRRILSASGTGIPLLSFPGEDTVRSRSQAFYGRAAECVEEALSAVGARGYLTESGLCVVPAEGLPVSMELSSADLLSDPVFVGNRQLLLRTRITGWPLGKAVRIKWKDGSQEGLVLERSVEADNLEGKWESEMLIEKRNG